MPELFPLPQYYHPLPPSPAADAATTELPITRHGIRQLTPWPFARQTTPSFPLLTIRTPGLPIARGVCGLLPATAFLDGSVRPHEDTLGARLDRQRDLVRRDRGALGKPVLLTTPKLPLIEDMPAGRALLTYRCNKLKYTLHTGRPANAPVSLPGEASPLVIADGHHRAYTHAALAAEGRPEFTYLPVVIVPGSALRIGAFQRLIAGEGRTLQQLQQQLAAYFTITPLPRPTPVTQSGMWLLAYRGQYAHLRRRLPTPDTDPGWLSRTVLPAVFGITDMRTDPRILSVDPPALHHGQYQYSTTLEDRISLLGYPVDHASFFGEVAAGRLFPPKSTRFEPRIPSGLLVWIPT